MRGLDRLVGLSPAPAIVSALLICGIVVQLAHGIRSLSDRNEQSLQTRVRSYSIPRKSSLDVKSIVDAHIFGSTEASSSVMASNLTPMVLTGVIAYGSATGGFGIIGANAGSTNLYHVGATLPDGSRLQRVFASYVVIERETVRERLPIALNSSRMVPAAIVDSRTETTGNNSENVDENVESQPPSWFARFAPIPIYKDGSFQGWKLFPKPHERSKYSLQASDLVTAINGIPLSNMDDAVKLLNDAGNQSLSLTVQRQGLTRSVTIDPATT